MPRFYLIFLFAMILFVKPTFAYYSEYNEVDYQKENDSTYHSVTDSVLPAWNYYANLFVFTDIISVFCGAVILDVDVESENRYRGSVIYNFSSIFSFYDIHDEWEGFRSIWSIGVGYRQYLETQMFSDLNLRNVQVKHRNVPYNSLSVFVQLMLAPSLMFDSDRSIESKQEEENRIGWGMNAIGRLGVVFNLKNFLWEIAFLGGYQYWNGVKSSVYNNKGFAFVNVCPSKGHCFGAEIKFGL